MGVALVGRRRSLIATACMMATLLPAIVATTPAVAATKSSYIVVLQDAVNVDAKVNLLERVQGFLASFRYRSALRGFAAELTPLQAAVVAADPDVLYLSPDRHVDAVGTLPVASGESVPTGVRRVEAASFSTANQPSSVNVAVIDTGVDLGHPDLNVVSATNCIDPTRTAHDDHGHGTHVAGTIAARNNGSGVVGVVPDTRLYAVKVLDQNGGGDWSQIICGIDWVTAHVDLGIRVANMSLGGYGGATDNDCGLTTSDALHKAICGSTMAGVTYAVAAGNGNTDLATFNPANYPEVLAVTAMSDSDGAPGSLGTAPSCRPGETDDAPASFSNYAVAQREIDHTVAAPGVCISSTWLGGGLNANVSGTSMASPHVAGAIARCFGAEGSAGPCTDQSPATVIQTVRHAAENHTVTTAGYGYSGDPAHEPVFGRYYGYLLWDGSAGAPITPSAPGAPPTLTATAGSGSVALGWGAPNSDGGSPVTNYRIYRGTSSDGETWLVTLGNVTSYNDTGLTNGTTYYYRVSAVNAAGEGRPSPERSATPEAKACFLICLPALPFLSG
jgi:subtilisin